MALMPGMSQFKGGDGRVPKRWPQMKQINRHDRLDDPRRSKNPKIIDAGNAEPHRRRLPESSRPRINALIKTVRLDEADDGKMKWPAQRQRSCGTTPATAKRRV